MKPGFAEAHLRCPVCRSERSLTLHETGSDEREVREGELRCGTCQSVFPVARGVAELLIDPPEHVVREAAGLERFADLMRHEGWDAERIRRLPERRLGLLVRPAHRPRADAAHRPPSGGRHDPRRRLEHLLGVEPVRPPRACVRSRSTSPPLSSRASTPQICSCAAARSTSSDVLADERHAARHGLGRLSSSAARCSTTTTPWGCAAPSARPTGSSSPAASCSSSTRRSRRSAIPIGVHVDHGRAVRGLRTRPLGGSSTASRRNRGRVSHSS